MDYNERRQRVEDLPIYKKGEEIYQMTRKICDLIPEHNDDDIPFNPDEFFGDDEED